MNVGGLLHIMLPDSSISPEKAQKQPAMFADTGLPLLLRSLVGLKADPSRLRVLLAGGASVLCTTDTFKIGERNARAARDFLQKQGLSVRHTMLGGTTNRTLHVNVGTGMVTVKMPTSNDTYPLGN
jgi:chemotaxis protein CheD